MFSAGAVIMTWELRGHRFMNFFSHMKRYFFTAGVLPLFKKFYRNRSHGNCFFSAYCPKTNFLTFGVAERWEYIHQKLTSADRVVKNE
jgi:hypothetical protein